MPVSRGLRKFLEEGKSLIVLGGKRPPVTAQNQPGKSAERVEDREADSDPPGQELKQTNPGRD